MPTIKKTPSLLPATAKGALLLIDWDNLFYSLYSRFGAEEMRIENRIKILMEWIKKEIGELLGGYGFVFAPEHLTYFHQQICVRNKLKLMICPKRQLMAPKRNPKTGDMETEEDTVDETVIWLTRMMLPHPSFKFICLVAGDNDYAPLFKEIERYGVKRALAVPTIDSLSRTKELIAVVDRHPATHKKMILRLDKIAV